MEKLIVRSYLIRWGEQHNGVVIPEGAEISPPPNALASGSDGVGFWCDFEVTPADLKAMGSCEVASPVDLPKRCIDRPKCDHVVGYPTATAEGVFDEVLTAKGVPHILSQMREDLEKALTSSKAGWFLRNVQSKWTGKQHLENVYDLFDFCPRCGAALTWRSSGVVEVKG